MTEEAEPRQLAPTHFDGEAGEMPPPPPGPAPTPADLQAVYDVPVKVQAVLGRSKMDIGALLCRPRDPRIFSRNHCANGPLPARPSVASDPKSFPSEQYETRTLCLNKK